MGCLMVVAYAGALAMFPEFWWTCTLCFGIPFAFIAIQNIYIDHDVMHGATFPPYEWQRFITHPVSDFFGLNDTGALFALEWFFNFPDPATGGKCNKEFWSKWVPRRCKHMAFVWGLWACVWLLGTYPLGRPLSEAASMVGRRCTMRPSKCFSGVYGSRTAMRRQKCRRTRSGGRWC